MYRLCKYCNQAIPEGRIEALPGIQTCLPCKQEHEPNQQIRGLMVFGHKTGGECVLVSPTQLAEITRLDRRGYKRATRS